ncbi:hypothetical protein NX059_010742 [Plenodomus lindquistii]|nr:hypothetical protein NX059_010742 [Plenodomus lindquistii]
MFSELWSEVQLLQACGVKVMGMLGGAAKGSYMRMGGGDADFEAHYLPLREMLRTAKLDGLDIDVEEDVAIHTVTRLIMRLRGDFGPNFLITLAPVASALIPNPFVLDAILPLNSHPQCHTAPSLIHPTLPHLSGFSYPDLERSIYGREIAWYNTQFYGGWGNARSTAWYDRIIEAGWSPERVVLGTLTNPRDGSDYVSLSTLAEVTAKLLDKYQGAGGGFGGVMGWEYANSTGTHGDPTGVCTNDPSSIKTEQARWAATLGGILRAKPQFRNSV